MSIPLASIDLSSFPVNSGSTVSLNTVGPTSSLNQYKNPAHLQIYNESGSGLHISFLLSGEYYLPAGAWQNYTLRPGETSLTFTVIYVLPNPPVTQLLITYFAPNEDVPYVPSIGNSPIGIGGTVQTSTVNQLINQGNPSLSNIINVQPSDAASATWTADNSGNFTIKSDNAGVLAFLLQLIAGASPAVKLGDTTISTEIMKNLTVDGTSTLTGSVNTTDSLHVGTTLYGAAGTLTIGDAVSCNSTLSLGGRLNFHDGSHILEIHGFSGTGSGTFNHNCSTTPGNIQLTCNATNSSQTMGYDSVTSTTVHVTTGANLAWTGLAIVYG